MFGELVEWILNLDRQFAFLLCLPFLVAAAGLLSETVLRRRSQRQPRKYGAPSVRRDAPVLSR
jgi:hypothetical protein